MRMIRQDYLKYLVDRYKDKFLSRWIVLILDLCIATISYILAYVIKDNFELSQVVIHVKISQIFVFITITLIGHLLFNSYVGIIRHTNLVDLIRITRSLIFSTLILFCISELFYYIDKSSILRFPKSIVLITSLVHLFTLVAFRLFIKALFHAVSGVGELKRVLIYGAGGSGIITKNTLLQDSASRYDIAGFIDDNTSKIGKTLEGIRIYGPNQVFNDFLNKNDISEVIISIQNISSLRKREMIELCMEKNVSVKTVPPAQKWINGELSSNQIKNIRIEDLLERDSIELSNENISREIDGKVIFVTGAAGSIGSEIVRQLLNFHPLKVVLIDQAESPLYDLEFELKNKHDASRFEVVVCDVTNYSRLNKAFQHFRPDHVFHAAAYKHVPLMELNPYEAVNVNIMGTRNLANLASEYKVSKFVFVSTDKAVNPTNVMGATKRAAEIYVQSLNANSSTSFITTRFGNVLGSNGSVIPTFRKQIENGGPITVTHKEITRYFMTIPEACQLVLEAGAMGKGGEIYVFDMGESVKIYDLATKMIKLSGLTLGKDIEIKITGLRPGEKLYEELLNEAETTMPTHHPKIMIGKVNEYPLDTVKDGLDEVSNLLQNSNDNMLLVRKLKELVPEYISKNSMYSQLDKEKTG